MPVCGSCLRVKCCLGLGSDNPEGRSRDPSDEMYDQNKVWVVLVLQLAYLAFLCAVVPYALICFPKSSTWFPVSVFLSATAGCSISACLVYALAGSFRTVYLSLILYGAVFPYVCWFCSGQYMATPAACWHWLTLSMVLTSLLSSWRQALWLLLLQAATPLAGGLLDACTGFEIASHALVLRTLSLIVPDLTVFLLLSFFSQVLKHSRNQALLREELGQAILRNILPMPVADRLMEELAVGTRCHIAHDYPLATVAFCDIVGFTQLCLTVSPSTLVEMLNDTFTCFDRLCLLHGVEKIKTIGDAYMFAGFPASNESPAEVALAVVHVAVRMIRHVMSSEFTGRQLQIRAGAHSGPVVAGVIGCTKFQYDVWGPTVNLASRLESTGLPNELQISATTRDLIIEKVPCTYRGNIPLKGAGTHDAYFVDLSAVPAIRQEDPELLRGLGLDDMAFLVQEINRRQATYKFAHGASVVPLGIPSSPSFIGPALRLSPSSRRRGAGGPPVPTGMSIVPIAGDTLELPETPAGLSRADRILRLIHASDDGPDNFSPAASVAAEVLVTDVPRRFRNAEVGSDMGPMQVQVPEQTPTGSLEGPAACLPAATQTVPVTAPESRPSTAPSPGEDNVHVDGRSDRAAPAQRSLCSRLAADPEEDLGREESPEVSDAGDDDFGPTDCLQPLCPELIALRRPSRGRKLTRRQSMCSSTLFSRPASTNPVVNLSFGCPRRSINVPPSGSPSRVPSGLPPNMPSSSPALPGVPGPAASPNRLRAAAPTLGVTERMNESFATILALIRRGDGLDLKASFSPADARESRIFDTASLAALSPTALPATSPLWALAPPPPPPPVSPLGGPEENPELSGSSPTQPPARPGPTPGPGPSSSPSRPRSSLTTAHGPLELGPGSPLRQWRRRQALEPALGAPEDWRDRLLPPFMRSAAGAQSPPRSGDC